MTTFDLARDDADAALSAAVDALRRDQLVVVPTETVYGVAGRRSARAAIDALKGSRASPYSLAVPSLDAAFALTDGAPPPAMRAAQRWWPGPVTLVLPDPAGGTLGVRVPGHTFTRELLERLGEPLLLPSANRSGEPAPTDLSQVSAAVAGAVAHLIDGGRCALGEASTVLACGASVLAVLREGVVGRDELERLALGRVAVVCSGNTCRSPMARALLERELHARARTDRRLLVPAVVSAGVHAGHGLSASRGAQAAMAALGIDLSDHLSQPLDSVLRGPLDRVLCMTDRQVLEVRALLDDRSVDVTLFDPLGHEVHDPFGGPPAEYEACATMLAVMAARRADALSPTLGTTP